MMRKRNTQREATARRDTSTILLIVVFVSVFLASALFWYINDRERFVTQEALVLDNVSSSISGGGPSMLDSSGNPFIPKGL